MRAQDAEWDNHPASSSLIFILILHPLSFIPYPSMFYSLDGIDGSGKTTQIALFCDWLRGRGQEVVVCRDPGSTRVGEEVRKLLLERDDLGLSRRAEMLLYMAARAQLVDEVISPALASGKTVVSDRFLLAN